MVTLGDEKAFLFLGKISTHWEVIKRKILIRYHFENEAQTNVGILKIKYDSRVLDEIKKLNQKYLLSIRILDD